MRCSLEIPPWEFKPNSDSRHHHSRKWYQRTRMDISWFGLTFFSFFLFFFFLKFWLPVAFVDSSQHQFSLLITSTWFNILKPSVKSGRRWESCSSPAQTL